MDHLSAETLIAYLTMEDSPDRQNVQEHVATCTACGEELESLRDMESLLRDDESWSSDQDPSGFERIAAFATRLEREDNEADRVLGGLSLNEVRKKVLGDDHLRHAGTIRHLITRSHTAVEAQPQTGLDLAVLARTVAERPSAGQYPGTVLNGLLGSAWKQEANALRQLGRYSEALGALDQAAKYFGQTTVPDLDLAAVAYVRATIAYATGQLALARDLAREAARTFVNFGETTRLQHARMLEAAILHEEGSHQDAAVIFRDLLARATDPDVRARLLHNLAHCLITEDPERAAAYFQQASQAYGNLGLLSEQARAQIGLGRLFLTRGDSEEAIRRFTNARDQLVTLGMTAAAAIAELDLIAAQLSTQDSTLLADRCRELARTFVAAGMNPHAATALDHLRRHLTLGTVNIAHIHDVQAFLEIHATSTAPFLPAK